MSIVDLLLSIDLKCLYPVSLHAHSGNIRAPAGFNRGLSPGSHGNSGLQPRQDGQYTVVVGAGPFRIELLKMDVAYRERATTKTQGAASKCRPTRDSRDGVSRVCLVTVRQRVLVPSGTTIRTPGPCGPLVRHAECRPWILPSGNQTTGPALAPKCGGSRWPDLSQL